MKRLVSRVKITWSLGLATLVVMLVTSSAQGQQQQLQVQQRQTTFATLNLNSVPQVEFAFEAALAEPTRVPSLTPDETAEIKRTLGQLHEAMSAERGDNLLAQVWDYEVGTISRNKRLAQPELLQFDPKGELSLREWLKSQLSVEVVKAWKNSEIHPISENGETITISVNDNSSTLKHLTFRPVGNHYQIVSIVFISRFC